MEMMISKTFSSFHAHNSMEILLNITINTHIVSRQKGHDRSMIYMVSKVFLEIFHNVLGEGVMF